jgi:SPW repeat
MEENIMTNIMTKMQGRLPFQWRDALNLILGIWLAVSPFALSYADQTVPALNALATGAAIAGAAVAALIAYRIWEEWISAILAAWLIVSPWILDVGGLQTAGWNQVVVGMLVGGLALYSAATARGSGGLATKS